MFNSFKVIRGIMKRKNLQLRAEREKYEAERAANVILSAYLALLVSRHGAVRVPKKEISGALGRFMARASVSGDDYVIEVGEVGAVGRGKDTRFGSTGKI